MNTKQRISEIKCELAEMKRKYFVEGITGDMKRRVTLEAELEVLRAAKYSDEQVESARKMNIRKARGDLMKARLDELGLGHLFDECNAQAEALFQSNTT